MATTITVRENVTATFLAGSVLSYTLTINKTTGVSGVTVTRTSSPLKGASTGTLSSGATIYYGDTLTASATASTGYNSPSLSWTSKTVSGNVTLTVSAGSVKAYTLTISSLPTGVASLTVKRTSSPLKGASTGTLSNGATIYYGDTLTASATASSNYNSPSVSWTSKTVTDNVTASVTAGSYNPPATGKVCICGEYGYHYCPCYGEYVDPDEESGGSGGGSSSEDYYTCACCGYYGPESDFVYISSYGSICDGCN